MGYQGVRMMPRSEFAKELYQELGGDQGIHTLRVGLFQMGYRYARGHGYTPHDAIELADEGTGLGWEECREIVLQIEEIPRCG